MDKKKKSLGHLKSKPEIKIELIPVYISEEEFRKKKIEVQNLIARMLISSQKRGRPAKEVIEELKNAA